MENHDPGIIFSQQPLEEFEPETTESVAVGNHNSFDSSLHAEFQKGKQPGPLEMEPGSNVDETTEGFIGELCVGSVGNFLFLVGTVSDLLSGRHSGICCHDSRGVRRTLCISWF